MSGLQCKPNQTKPKKQNLEKGKDNLKKVLKQCVSLVFINAAEDCPASTSILLMAFLCWGCSLLGASWGLLGLCCAAQCRCTLRVWAANPHSLINADRLIKTPAIVPQQAVHIHSAIYFLPIYPMALLDVSKCSQSRITEHTGKEGKIKNRKI